MWPILSRSQRILWIEAATLPVSTYDRHGNGQRYIPLSSPDSTVHGADTGPSWGRQDPGGPHVGPMNLTIWEHFTSDEPPGIRQTSSEWQATPLAMTAAWHGNTSRFTGPLRGIHLSSDDSSQQGHLWWTLIFLLLVWTFYWTVKVGDFGCHYAYVTSMYL